MKRVFFERPPRQVLVERLTRAVRIGLDMHVQGDSLRQYQHAWHELVAGARREICQTAMRARFKRRLVVRHFMSLLLQSNRGK